MSQVEELFGVRVSGLGFRVRGYFILCFEGAFWLPCVKGGFVWLFDGGFAGFVGAHCAQLPLFSSGYAILQRTTRG